MISFHLHPNSMRDVQFLPFTVGKTGSRRFSNRIWSRLQKPKFLLFILYPTASCPNTTRAPNSVTSPRGTNSYNDAFIFHSLNISYMPTPSQALLGTGDSTEYLLTYKCTRYTQRNKIRSQTSRP